MRHARKWSLYHKCYLKDNQSTENADRGGCLTFYMPLKVIGIYSENFSVPDSPFSVFFGGKGSFPVFSRTAAQVSLFTQCCSSVAFYCSIYIRQPILYSM